MLINIQNIADKFCDFWEKANKLDYEEKKVLWKEIYEIPNKQIFHHLESIYKTVNSNYNVDDSLEACFQRYKSSYKKIRLLSDNIENNTANICKSCSEVFNVNDLKLNFITMVGQFNANAFVTPYNGKTAFYFLEQMPEERYVDILLAHEITHLFHFSKFIGKESKASLAERIFMDGLACFTSSVICPGFTIAEYLNFDSRSNQWLHDCEVALPSIKAEVINNIERLDYNYFLKYFSLNYENMGEIPKRIGYLIGYKVVSHLSKTHSLDELILWDSERVIEEVKEAVSNII